MEWIKTEEQLPSVGQQIEMTCKHWEANWVGQFEYPYIEQGSCDEFGNFWNAEGCRLHDPSYWRPYQPERSKREDLVKMERWTTGNPPKFMDYELRPIPRCGALNTVETQ